MNSTSNIPSRTVQVFDWFDIQTAICDEMQINESYFRDYHKLVGGEYKDLWHVAMQSIVPDDLVNGSIVRVYNLDDLEYSVESHGEYTREFFTAYIAVFKRMTTDDSALVEFSW